MIRPAAAPVAIDSMVTSVVKIQPTSTRNMTGFRAMLRGSSIKNERIGRHLHQRRLEQIEPARLATLQFQSLDIGLGRSGNRVGVRRVIAKIFLIIHNQMIG